MSSFHSALKRPVMDGTPPADPDPHMQTIGLDPTIQSCSVLCLLGIIWVCFVGKASPRQGEDSGSIPGQFT